MKNTDNKNALGEGFRAVYEMYFDMVYRICFIFFRGNKADTEDAVHTVFMKYIENKPDFEREEHRKAWLIVTAQNVCKSVLRLARRKNISLDETNGNSEWLNKSEDFVYNDVLDAVMRLPDKEKTAVYLCYYEDMTALQAAQIMGCKENTVYSYLHRAKKKLKKSLGE